jgi:hypothetical protein
MVKTLFLFCVLLVFAGDAFAQDPLELEDQKTTSTADDWGLVVTPYAWFAAQSTDVGGARIRQSFNDLASITNLGFQMRVMARWRWMVFVADGTYANLKADQEVLLVRTELDIKQFILDLKLGGKVYDTRTSAQDGGIGLWVSGGARYWDNTVDYTVTTQPVLPGRDPEVDTGKSGQTWWDPVVGVHGHFPVTPGVGFLVKLTGGGLGIGNASKYLWDAEFVALFRLSRRLLLSAGYRQFKYNRTDGDGEQEVEQTVTVVGPAIGLSIGIY